MWSSARTSPAARRVYIAPLRPARALFRRLWTPRPLDCGRRVLFLGLPTLSLPPRPRLTGPDGHAEAQAEAVASRAVERGHVVTTIDPRAFGDGFFLQLMYTATLRHIFTF